MYLEHDVHVFGYGVYKLRDGSNRSASKSWGGSQAFLELRQDPKNKLAIANQLSDFEAMFRYAHFIYLPLSVQ